MIERVPLKSARVEQHSLRNHSFNRESWSRVGAAKCSCLEAVRLHLSLFFHGCSQTHADKRYGVWPVKFAAQTGFRQFILRSFCRSQTRLCVRTCMLPCSECDVEFLVAVTLFTLGGTPRKSHFLSDGFSYARGSWLEVRTSRALFSFDGSFVGLCCIMGEALANGWGQTRRWRGLGGLRREGPVGLMSALSPPALF